MTVGARVRNLEWEGRTTGSVHYVSDVQLPGTLVARTLRSPWPHARILEIDTSEAARAPGVAAVLVARDLPDVRYFHEGPLFADRRPLARDVVRFVGEEVAVVAAETAEQAETALRKLRVRYRPLRAATTLDRALAPGAPRIHERRQATNVALAVDRSYGSPDAGAASAALSVRGTYRFGRQAHACMEPNGTLARWDAASESLELWTSTQSPWFVRTEIAHLLGLDMAKVVVHEVAVGGGFGSKSNITDHEVLAAALAMRTGRPVRLVLSREEEFATTKCRHDFVVDLETGVSADGRLTHRSADILVDNGAYNHSGASVTQAALGELASLYRLDGVRVKARLVDTNKHPGGQFRGYGSPQVLFAAESQMDELADRLGMDPIELRIRNANRQGEVTLAGWRLASARLVECLEAVREAIGWEDKRKLGGSGRGVGVAVAIHVSGAHTFPEANRSDAGVDVLDNGRVRVRFGGSDPGTGLKTILAQVAARELGVDLGSVEVVTMETAETGFDPGSWSSRGTFMGGHAVATAARSAAARLREVAASKFGVAPDQVRLDGGQASSDGERVAIGDLVVLAQGPGGELRVDETFTADVEMVNPETGVGNLSAAYAFAAHAVEVEVDPDTGKVRVLDYVAAHDCGAAINPVGVESQIVGGVVMGLGAALGEQLIYQDGRLVNPAYLHYGLPRAADVPTIRPLLVDGDDPLGPYGAKSVGEISLCPVPAAVANAVAHAVGVRFRELPLTPDKVLAGLRTGGRVAGGRVAGGRVGGRRGAAGTGLRLWRRPDRWWIHLVRWSYPRGLHAVLHRWGTRLARTTSPAPVRALSRPVTVSDATALLSADPGARPVGGGTDLLPAREQGLARPTHLVDTTAVPDLQRVWETTGGDLRIGAGVTLADLVRQTDRDRDAVLHETVSTIASQQVREMATVAGNLCQEKRCWFYRNGFLCYKRGGATCPCYAVTGDHRFHHAVLGAHRCQAVTPSDLATTLAALDAVAHVAGAGRGRRVPVAELFAGPGETRLARDELITLLEVPARARARASHFEKLRLWEGDFAVVSACASLELSPDRLVLDARVVLGAVAPTPYRAREVERSLIGSRLTDATIAGAAESWAVRADPLPGNAWKVDAGCGVLRRCLQQLAAPTRPGAAS